MLISKRCVRYKVAGVSEDPTIVAPVEVLVCGRKATAVYHADMGQPDVSYKTLSALLNDHRLLRSQLRQAGFLPNEGRR